MIKQFCQNYKRHNKMSAFNEDILHTFQCKQCQKYLSIEPIKVNKDGDSICGRCTNKSKDCFNNVHLTTLLKEIKFPCGFDKFGCDASVKFGDEAKKHEENCIFGLNLAEDNDTTISQQTLETLRCMDTKCKQLLNVPPIYINSENTQKYCGRCTKQYQELPILQLSPIVRYTEYEKFASVIKYPCRYFSNGCRSVQRFSEVELHEQDLCRYRDKYNCCVVPFGSCERTESLTGLVSHFVDHHQRVLLIEDLNFTENLSYDKDINRLVLTAKKEVFVTMLRVRTQEKKLWLCTYFLGNQIMASDYEFSFEICGEGKGIFYTDTKTIAPHYYLHIREEDCITVSTETLTERLMGNVENVTVTLKIAEKQSPEDHAIYQFAECQWPECDHYGSKLDIFEHEKVCSYFNEPCKWCSEKFKKDLLEEHEKKECRKRRVECKWCSKTFLHYLVDDHSDRKCFRRKVECDFCKRQINHLNFENHKNEKCPKRKKL